MKTEMCASKINRRVNQLMLLFILDYGVMVSTQLFDSRSLDSNSNSPTKKGCDAIGSNLLLDSRRWEFESPLPDNLGD